MTPIEKVKLALYQVNANTMVPKDLQAALAAAHEIEQEQDRPSNRSSALDALNILRDHCHQTSVSAGWWNIAGLQTLDYTNAGHIAIVEGIRNDLVGTKFALIHSEISEALEGYRKGINDSHLPDLLAVDVELADALIRIFDLAGYLGCDLATAVERKMAYNRTRADHSAAARSAPGGKKF